MNKIELTELSSWILLQFTDQKKKKIIRSTLISLTSWKPLY